MFSLMCASWVEYGDSVHEGWLAGASMDLFGRITGLFFHTVDGGKTYELAQVGSICISLLLLPCRLLKIAFQLI